MVGPFGDSVDPPRPSRPADRSTDPSADRPPHPASDRRERGATRTQYIVLVLLVAVAFVLTALLLWNRLDGDAGLAVTWLI